MKTNRMRIFLISLLVVCISLLHYSTGENLPHLHILYRELYFLPLILGGLWYGLRGGLFTSLGVTACYLPFVLWRWNDFATADLNAALEIILFNATAALIGGLRDRELRRHQEKLEAVAAMAATVAHELNTPLQIVLGNAQLLQDNFEPGSTAYGKLETIISDIHRLARLVRKMSNLERVELRPYAGDTKILSLDGNKDGPAVADGFRY